MTRHKRTRAEVEQVKADILAYLRQCKTSEDRTPTRYELAAALGIKTLSLVTYYLAQLEADGLIERGGTSLSIKIKVVQHETI